MSDEMSSPKVVSLNSDAMFPKFDMQKFGMPNMEVPPAFREFAEKGIAQAREGYDKIKANAESATETLETTYAVASKGYADYGMKVIETARANTNAAYDLMGELMGVKSYAAYVELTTAFMRNRFEALTAQSKELSEHAQKVATESAEPLKQGFAKLSKAA